MKSKILLLILAISLFCFLSKLSNAEDSIHTDNDIEMLKLDYSSIVGDAILQVIIPTLIKALNEDIKKMGLVDEKYVCKVKYHDAYFFAKENEGNGFIVLEKLDISYLIEKFRSYYNNHTDNFLYFLVEKQLGSNFLSFHYGRFQKDTEKIEIDIVSKATMQEFKFGIFNEDNRYFGNLVVNPYFDVTAMTPNAHILVSNLGVAKFFAIFTLLHEASHYIEYLTFWINDPERFDEKVPKCYLSSEKQINDKAFKLLDKYWNKIDFFVKNWH